MDPEGQNFRHDDSDWLSDASLDQPEYVMKTACLKPGQTP
jgi:hypothetical protein